MKLKIENLSFGYDKKLILKNVNFEVAPGEFLCILGANGSGKSTLLNCICRIHKPRSGSVYFDDTEINKLNNKSLSRIISYVPQNYNPVFDFSIKDFLLMGRTPYSTWINKFSKDDIDIVDRTIAEFKLDSKQSISELSGGERKKLLLIRALVQDSPFIILDEPSNQLDFGMKTKFLELLKSLTSKGKSILITTHSPEDALNFSDKILYIYNHEVNLCTCSQLTADTINQLYNIQSEIIYGADINKSACLAKNIS